MRSPCPKCYDTGVYYEPIGPDGEKLQPMVCPYAHNQTGEQQGGDADAR